jgi:uncharacterized protein YndB with AHSA1/START domain
MTENRMTIMVSTTIKSEIEKVWVYWNQEKHIKQWYFNSDEKQIILVENKLELFGNLKIRSSTEDNLVITNINGTYIKIIEHQRIEYVLKDSREVHIQFYQRKENVNIIQTIEVDNLNAMSSQQSNWQTTLNRFRDYVHTIESNEA